MPSRGTCSSVRRGLLIPESSPRFYEVDDRERLVAASKANGLDACLVVLLGG
jgi:hypothetical protein